MNEFFQMGGQPLFQQPPGQMQMQGEMPPGGMPSVPMQGQVQGQGTSSAPSPIHDTLPSPQEVPAAGGESVGVASVGAAPAGELRWLRVQHETRYRYGTPVELAHHVAHLSPRNTPHQQVRDWVLVIDPPPDEQALRSPDGGAWVESAVDELANGQFSTDSWGNRRLAFSHARVHDSLLVSSSFEVGIAPVQLGDPMDGPSWEAVAESLRYHAGTAHSEAVEFTLPSFFAPRAPQLAAFGREAFVPGMPLMAGALALMRQVHQRFEYKPNSTSVATRALEALALSKGVCQDFAHVMIGACRSLGLAARYVSGYLLTQPPPGQPRLLGADASHAWMEIWCPLRGWVALDPTNDVPASVDHVTLAWGRDYADVAPLRGVIRGGGGSQPHVAVTVEPLS